MSLFNKFTPDNSVRRTTSFSRHESFHPNSMNALHPTTNVTQCNGDLRSQTESLEKRSFSDRNDSERFTQKHSDTYCNNCGKPGHIYNQCKIPITSFGIIAFRYNVEKEPEFLMIRRKDTLGYIDFMRGKYLVQNKNYIMNMLKQMTVKERAMLREGNFDKLWKTLWGENSVVNKYKTEEISSKEKYDLLFLGILNKDVFFTLCSMLDECDTLEVWDEPEWGFPKGRRNYQEKDYECAIREFCEETGYFSEYLKNIQNIFPYEEIFTGSNYKSYKHKYYLMYMDYDDSLISTNFESSEVSKMEWKKYDDCINVIRPYNLEKKRIITNIYNCIHKYVLCR